MTRDKNMNEPDDKTMNVRRQGSGRLFAASRKLRPGLYPDHVTTLPGSAASGSVWAHYLDKNRAKTVDYCPRLFDPNYQDFVPLMSSVSLNERIQTRPKSELTTNKEEKSRSKVSESAHNRARRATCTESYHSPITRPECFGHSTNLRPDTRPESFGHSTNLRPDTRPESFGHSTNLRPATRPESFGHSTNLRPDTRPESFGHSANLRPDTRPEIFLSSTTRPVTLAGPPRQCNSASPAEADMSCRNHQVSDGQRFSSGSHRSQTYRRPSNGTCNFERNVCKNGVALRPVSSLYHFPQNRRKLLEDVCSVLRERRVRSAAPRFTTHPAAASAHNNPDMQSVNTNPDMQSVNTNPDMQSVNTNPDMQGFNTNPDMQSVNTSPDMQGANPSPDMQGANTSPDIQGVNTSPDIDEDAFNLKQSLAKFRELGRRVVHLLRVMKAIVHNCSDKTLKSANELQWKHVYAEKHDVTLAFNKHLYSRDRAGAHVPDWAVSILDLSPGERTEQECRRLHALLRGLTSFDKFTCEIQMSLCRAFTLARVVEGRVVLKSGHVGVNFYFIYTGSVFVNVEDTTREGRKFMRTVAVLTRGESFGELALLQDIRRTATISVRENCELLVVDKHVFASVCPQIFERELAEKYTFLSSLDLFSAKFWSPESIRYLAMNAQIQEYKMNKMIVTDSFTDEWIYICMQGRCQVLRCLSLDKPIQDLHAHRKTSQVVLSKEILELLSSAVAHHDSGGSHYDEDMKENLLTSLGLDYVNTGKRLHVNSKNNRKSFMNVNETLTLTSFIKRREEEKDEFVVLSLGSLEAGQIFDLPSLLDENSNLESRSPLMLVSAGAKIVRVKKAAFMDQASQQALDNTRTLASKHRNPSDDTILFSYKSKLAWEEFKSNLVNSVRINKQQRYQPIYRSGLKLKDESSKTWGRNTEKVSGRRIISALERNYVLEDNHIYCSEDEEISDKQTNDDIDSERNSGVMLHSERNSGVRIAGRRRSLCLDDIDPVCQDERIIIRRNLAPNRAHTRISRRPKTAGESRRPKTCTSIRG